MGTRDCTSVPSFRACSYPDCFLFLLLPFLFLLRCSCTHPVPLHSLLSFNSPHFAALCFLYVDECKIGTKPGAAADWRRTPSFFLSLLRYPLSAVNSPIHSLSLFSFPSLLPCIHPSHSLPLCYHRSRLVIPLIGTAQLIQSDSIASDRFSPSPHALVFSKYVLFCHQMLRYTDSRISRFLIFSPLFFPSTTYLLPCLPKSFRPLAFLFSLDACGQLIRVLPSSAFFLVSQGIISRDVQLLQRQ